MLRPREDLPGEFATFSEAWVEVVGEGQGRFEDCEGDRGPPCPPYADVLGKVCRGGKSAELPDDVARIPVAHAGEPNGAKLGREIDKTGEVDAGAEGARRERGHQKTLQFTEGKERTECVS